MKLNAPNLTDIFKQTLAEQLAAEKKYSKFIDKIPKYVITDELRSAISPSATDIESHISRLSQVMETVKQKSQVKGAIIDEEMLKMLKVASHKDASLLNDVRILHILKLIFNVKVARYESLYRMAKALGFPEQAMLLEQCSKDNQNTFAYLNQVEQNVIYPETQKSQIAS